MRKSFQDAQVRRPNSPANGRDARRMSPADASRRLSAFGVGHSCAPLLFFALARYGGLLPSGPALAGANFKGRAALVLGRSVPACPQA